MADYEFNPGEIVTAVNRSSKRIEWRFNSVSYVLQPGERKPMNLTYALYGVRRNPVMGTYNPAFEDQHQSLVGIVELKDQYPIDPIEQSDCLESIDRSALPEDRQRADHVRLGWSDTDRLAAGRNPVPEDAGFAGVMADK